MKETDDLILSKLVANSYLGCVVQIWMIRLGENANDTVKRNDRTG